MCPADVIAEPHRRAEIAPGSPFHTAWVRLRESGRTAIVPPSRAADADYLAARGITDLLPHES
ncbi:hypothetical protein [Herbihabitans rhizosphaerae]|uniref:hypothetical protein n=1 Tax=Herbihabitans rhizosphaerae TaxID=1872711 RepID=UPI001A935789|nr:hypothetical protein [Herbihabitans rhizosphaerae]